MANRQLIMFNMVSLDGFFAGPRDELDFHRVDDEFHEFAIAQLDEAGGLLFGRKTYDLMAAYWPEEPGKSDPEVARRMNQLPKYVFSKTLGSVPWENCTLIASDPEGAVRALKEQPGGPILILGSAGLSAPLIDAGLIDEFRFMVCPVAIGKGRTVFGNTRRWAELRLLSTRSFAGGNVLLCYAPATTYRKP